MKQVAKTILIDEHNQYLMLQRSGHPTFPCDPDLPGGTVEPGEQVIAALVREVREEVGVVITPVDVELLYQGNEFSAHDTEYSLYICRLAKRPEITISWEHEAYEWLSRKDFLVRARAAKDTYMQMVYTEMTKG